MKEVKTPKRPLIYYYGIVLLIILLFNTLVTPMLSRRQVVEVDYGTFMDMIDERDIGMVQVEDTQILFTDKDGSVVYETVPMEDPTLTQRLHDAGAEFARVMEEPISPIWSFLLTFVLPILIFVGLGQYMNKKLMEQAGGKGSLSFGMGKSSARVYVQSTKGIRFADVAGEDEAKESLSEIVDYLHDPGKYTEAGASMPKGILLVGPPGTGKTLLARACAGEAGVPFYSISGSDFVEMYVGVGASRVRDLFDKAKKTAPSIIFIDEIDAVGRQRGTGLGGGHDEREQTLNQLLTEMDGFDGSKGVIILAATNRPETLDKALLRPGRFDRRIPVELPDLEGRAAILKVHARKVMMDENVDYMAIARATSGASGAELANMINEAALLAVKNGRRIVRQSDLEEAVETVIAGYQRKNKVLSQKEKRIVAYHEIGHALVAAKQTESAPVTKITIVPRTSGALGYTMQVPQEETNLLSRQEALNKIATFTGGRAAEELIFGSYTSGASGDIEQATRLARSMVTRLGMSRQFDMMALETTAGKYLNADSTLACSEGTAEKIDEEVLSIIKEAHEKATGILKENIDKLHELAAFLMERESITGEEFMEILNRQPLPEQTNP